MKDPGPATFTLSLVILALCVPCGYYGAGWLFTNVLDPLASHIHFLTDWGFIGQFIWLVLWGNMMVWPLVLVTFAPWILFIYAKKEITKDEQDEKS